MKSITINGSKRESVGKKSVHFSAEELAFSKLVYTPNAHTVVIALGSDTMNAVLQDIQFHPVTDRILHVDFYQLFDDKEIAMDIPVHFIGKSLGVANGGSLRKNKRKLRVKALPSNLPDSIEADITPLKIGGKLYVTELANESFKFLHPDNTVVCQVKRSRVSIDEEELEEVEEGTAEGAAPAEGVAAPADA